MAIFGHRRGGGPTPPKFPKLPFLGKIFKFQGGSGPPVPPSGSAHVIYFSAPTSVPNMKALASILFEISCTQDFQILFSKGHNSKKGHNLAIQKNTGELFYHEECVYEISKP